MMEFTSRQLLGYALTPHRDARWHACLPDGSLLCRAARLHSRGWADNEPPQPVNCASCLRKLDPNYRKVFEYHEVCRLRNEQFISEWLAGGVSYSAIGRKYGISPARVHQIILQFIRRNPDHTSVKHYALVYGLPPGANR